MSRCFPCPLPGNTLHRVKNEALIESIKLQKEKQKEEESREKKDKRKERKEKRKERKEKKERKDRRKEKKHKINPNLDKSDIVKDHISFKTRSDPKDEFIQKRRETKSEQFEQSSLTEEHGHPDSLPAPSSSYDSTENSNKRKRHSSPVDGSQGHGKAILIRLPSKREGKFHSLANGQQCCLISRHTDCSAQHKDDTGLMRDMPESCNVEQGFNIRNNREEICSTSGQNIVPGERRMPNAVVNPMQGVESQYKFLLESWFPPRLEDASNYPVDSDWLFQDEDEQGEKRQRWGSESMSCSRSSALWARADYLHEIDAYALPYVVPY